MTTTITARIDSERKILAESILSDLGLTLSSAVNMFLNAVVQYDGIPFTVQRHRKRGGVDFSRVEKQWTLPDDFERKFAEADREIAALMVGEPL